MVRWWQTVLVVAVTFILAVSLRNDFLFFLLGFEVMMVVAAVVFVYMQSRHVRLKICPDRQMVQVGETFRIRAVLANDSVLPVTNVQLRIAVRAFPDNDWLLLKGKTSLTAHEEGAVCFELDGTHVQVLDIRADKLVIEDYLGIARKIIPVNIDDIYTMYILPGPDRSEAVLPETDRRLVDSSGEDVKSGGSDVDVSEIRQYMEGDPLKLVHWKLSARLDDIMVRSMTDPADTYMWIFLNLDERQVSADNSELSADKQNLGRDSFIRKSPDKWDCFVMTVSSISLSLLDSDRRHMVCWVNAAMGMAEKHYVSDEDSYQGMLKALLRTDTYFSEPGNNDGHTRLLEEIFSNEAKEMCIEVDLQGHTFRSGR